MSPVGAPDGGYNPQATAASQIDTGFLGDRLLMGGGSASKSGRVLWATGFEEGDLYSMIDAPGASVVPGNASLGAGGIIPAWQGRYYLNHLTNGTNGYTIFTSKQLPGGLVTGRWAYEAMFCLRDVNSQVDFDLRRDGVTAIPGDVSLDADIQIVNTSAGNIKMLYQNAGGTFTQFADLSNLIDFSSNIWHNIKIVVDFSTGKYVRVILDGRTYSLAGIAITFSAPGVGEFASVGELTTANAAAVQQSGFDNLIVTVDEP